MKAEDLYISLTATSLASQLTASAAKPFEADLDELESGSATAASVAYIKNHLSDAQKSLTDAEGEIGRLIRQIQRD